MQVHFVDLKLKYSIGIYFNFFPPLLQIKNVSIHTEQINIQINHFLSMTIDIDQFLPKELLKQISSYQRTVDTDQFLSKELFE